jgi:hypothetical protein
VPSFRLGDLWTLTAAEYLVLVTDLEAETED